RVDREYYINDVGNQMNNLGRAAWLRYKELLKQEVVFPDDLYQGAYLYDIAKDIILKHGKKFLDMAENEAVPFFMEYVSTTILKGIQDDLASFGVTFDSWFSEKQLFDNGTVQRSLEAYREKKYAYEKDGALWFGTEKYGDEKDRVIIRDDGRTTYFASDISYHEDKLKRGYQHLIDIWGADHHGYVPRVRAALEALGLPHDAFNVILVQMVNLLREGVPVAMSTRAGEFVTLKEVIDEVGSDAARFLFLTRRSDAQLDFDLEVAKKQSDENPVYYVQYAHARICSIISVAAERGLALPAWEDVAVDRLSEPEDLDLVKQLSRFPETVAGSALAYEPHRIATFLMDLVGRFHSYYNKHRVITDDADLSRARLFLISSIR
ncbi:MAG: arginine--tRNA ligase, partial [Deltaproteobacteria bacterium]|nr:arginine--tRNA ligase [Deltaproteobacteria bacterium]